MTGHETRRLKLIPFTLLLKRVALAEKRQLGAHLAVRVPDNWPGPDITEALPFMIAEMEKRPSAPVWDGIIVHKEDQVIIGDMGFKGPPDVTGRVEIGYSIIPEYRNQGYATEMACHLITWALQQSGVTSVVAECLNNNVGSIKVLEKAGMKRLPPEGDLLKWETRTAE